jgi:hypothetical protein
MSICSSERVQNKEPGARARSAFSAVIVVIVIVVVVIVAALFPFLFFCCCGRHAGQGHDQAGSAEHDEFSRAAVGFWVECGDLLAIAPDGGVLRGGGQGKAACDGFVEVAENVACMEYRKGFAWRRFLQPAHQPFLCLGAFLAVWNAGSVEKTLDGVGDAFKFLRAHEDAPRFNNVDVRPMPQGR